VDARYRQGHRDREGKHGWKVRRRLNNLPQLRNQREFNSSNHDSGRDWNW
jgi:hypothetical protein